VRAIVITESNGTFAAGTDLQEMAGLSQPITRLFFDKMSPRNSARPQPAAAWRATADAAAPGRTWVQPGDGGVVEVAGKTCLGHQVGRKTGQSGDHYRPIYDCARSTRTRPRQPIVDPGPLETAVAVARDWAAVEPLAIVASEHLFCHAADLPTGMRCRRPGGHHGDLETARMIRHGSAPHRTTGPDSQSAM
jgi:hypothetical protein